MDQGLYLLALSGCKFTSVCSNVKNFIACIVNGESAVGKHLILHYNIKLITFDTNNVGSLYTKLRDTNSKTPLTLSFDRLAMAAEAFTSQTRQSGPPRDTRNLPLSLQNEKCRYQAICFTVIVRRRFLSHQPES